MLRKILALSLLLTISNIAAGDNLYNDLVVGLADAIAGDPQPINANVGNWTLGSVDGTLGNFTAYTNSHKLPQMPGCTIISSNNGTDKNGNFTINSSASAVSQPGWPNGMNWPANSVVAMSSDQTEGLYYPMVKWTAPSAGDYDVSALFTVVSGTGPEITATVKVNGASVYSQAISSYGTSDSYSSTLSLADGDVVSFASSSATTFAQMSMDLDVTAVPEPATMGLLAIGGLVGLLRKRR